MAINYETGTSDSQVDLVAKLATFLGTATHWNVVKHSTVGQIATNLSDAQVSFRIESPHDEVYFYLFSRVAWAQPRMGVWGTTDHTNDVLATSQTGGPIVVTSNDRVGISVPVTGVTFTYFFIAGPTYLHCVLKYAQGTYQHFSFGRLTNYPNVNKGYWFSGFIHNGLFSTANSNWNTDGGTGFGDYRYACPWGSLTTSSPTTSTSQDYGHCMRHDGTWIALRGASTSDWGSKGFSTFAKASGNNQWVGDNAAYLPLLNFPPVTSSAANITTPLIPVQIQLPKIGRSDWFAMQGAIPGARVCWTEGYAEDEAITIGSDTWKIFPVTKTRRSSYSTARWIGVAFQIVEGA